MSFSDNPKELFVVYLEGANGGTQFSVNYYFFGQISVNYYFFGQFSATVKPGQAHPLKFHQ